MDYINNPGATIQPSEDEGVLVSRVVYGGKVPME